VEVRIDNLLAVVRDALELVEDAQHLGGVELVAELLEPVDQ
jgi:hypothetical protein